MAKQPSATNRPAVAVEGNDAADRTTPFGLWRYAFEYVKASKLIDDNDKNEWVASSVTYQNVCQGIELVLKAFLRAHGFDLDALRAIGHSLVRCAEAAANAGFPRLGTKAAHAIAMVDPYYKNHEFRYIKTGIRNYPGYGELLRAAAELLDATAPKVAKAMGHEALSYRMQLDTSAAFGTTPPPKRPPKP